MVIRNLLLACNRRTSVVKEQIPLVSSLTPSYINVEQNGEVIYAVFSDPGLGQTPTLFVSTDSGDTWQTRINTFPGTDIQYVQGFDDGNTVWALLSRGLIESTDCGATWAPTSSSYINTTGNRRDFWGPSYMTASTDKQIVYAFGEETYFSGQTTNLYKSVNFGITFNVVMPDNIGWPGPDPSALWCSNDGQIAFLLTYDIWSVAYVTYRSFDGFSTRTVIPSPPTGTVRIKGSSDASVLVCNVRSGWQSVDTEFYVSTDFGTSWAKITSIGTVKTADAYDFDVTDDGKTLVVLGNTGITKYTNF